jgi:hypothetical protein
VLAALSAKASPSNDTALLSDHLSLLRRWYFRPEKQRAGEIFLPNPDGTWPIRRILRGAARMTIGEPAPMAETNREGAREGAKAAKVKILHAGRPDVERIVPVYNPDSDPASEDASPTPPLASESPATFTSRRSK